MKKLSKTETEKQIKEFFSEIKNKSSKEVKKMKKLAMSHNIHLKDFRKKFCKKCLTPYSGKEKIRIKKGIKTIECLNCKGVSRYKIR